MKKIRKLSELEIEHLDELWFDFESVSGHRSPTQAAITTFHSWLMMHGEYFTIGQIHTWCRSYFIPESLLWLDKTDDVEIIVNALLMEVM